MPCLTIVSSPIGSMYTLFFLLVFVLDMDTTGHTKIHVLFLFQILKFQTCDGHTNTYKTQTFQIGNIIGEWHSMTMLVRMVMLVRGSDKCGNEGKEIKPNDCGGRRVE